MALPTTVTGIVPDGTTNAQFQAWGQNVSVLIANTGMTKVTATGNIDWTTVATSTGEAGFEIWAFADALQVSAPVYFRLGYGGAGATARPALYLTLGGALGAGNATIATLGGAAQTTSNLMISGNVTSTNTAFVSFACGNASSLVLGLWCGTTNVLAFASGGPPYSNTALPSPASLILSIERTHDANGADTTEGVNIFASNNTQRTWKQVHWNGTTGMGTASFESSAGVITPQMENKYPGQLGYFGNFFTKAGGVFNGPSLNILHTMTNGPATASGYGVQEGPLTIGQIHKVWVANAYHQYVALTPSLSGITYTRALIGGNTCFMIRYE